MCVMFMERLTLIEFLSTKYIYSEINYIYLARVFYLFFVCCLSMLVMIFVMFCLLNEDDVFAIFN